MMLYYTHIIIVFLFYSVLGFSLNLVVGQLGVLLLCQSAFFALGSYTIGILCGIYNLPFIVALCMAPIVALIPALPLMYVSNKLRHDALVLVSLAVLMITLEIIENMRGFTGGIDGLIVSSEIVIGKYMIISGIDWIIFMITFFLIVIVINKAVINSLLSKRLRAFRDEPVVYISIGGKQYYDISVLFFISVTISSVAGGIYAIYTGYINPAMFSFDHSILILTIVIIGGVGTLYGPIIGSSILILLPELFRLIGVNDSSVGAIQQLLYGLALLVFVLWKPRGILRGYKFG